MRSFQNINGFLAILGIALSLSCLDIVFALENGTFTNPIFEGISADPAVLRVGNFYYLTLSTDSETSLTVYKSPVLTSFRNAESKVVYRAKPYQSNLWASDGNGTDHRMYAIKAENSSNPLGNWSDAIQLMTDWDWGAIDGTILKQNGSLYFLYASTYPAKPPNYPQLAILIAPMRDALNVTLERTVLREPRSDWECVGSCIDEGPYFIYNKGVSYMIFSASGSFSTNYCLGMMFINSTADPMDPGNWNYGEDRCIFERNEEESVFSPGHATFTTSPDGTETWMVN